MAHRLTSAARRCSSGGLHPHYRAVTETISHYSGARGRSGCARSRRRRFEAECDGDTSCVVVQNPDVFGRVRDLSRLAAKAHAAGALLVVVVTEAVSLGLVKPPGAMGADIVGGRRPVHRQRPQFRRALSRPVRHPREIRPPDARAAVRPDGRCRRPARLGADPFDARAAYPPREGDQQYLHEFRPVRAGLHRPSDAAGRSGLTAAGRAQPCQAVQLADALARVRASDRNAALLQRIHGQDAEARRRSRRWAGGPRHLGGVPASRLWPEDKALANHIIVAATEVTTEDDIAAYTAALGEVLHG